MYRYKYLLVNAIVSAKQNSSRSTLRLKRLSHNKMKWNIYIYIYIFYQYIVTHTFKQHKNLSTRCKYIGSTWEKHKNKLLIKKLTKNN